MPASQPDRSAGRFPDGADSDFNCRDFLLQTSITLLAPAAASSTNIKVASVADLNAGQKIIIGKGTNSETAIIAAVGTPGGTTVGTFASAGKKVIVVASVEGFNPGQSVTIGSGKNSETVVIAAGSQVSGSGVMLVLAGFGCRKCHMVHNRAEMDHWGLLPLLHDYAHYRVAVDRTDHLAGCKIFNKSGYSSPSSVVQVSDRSHSCGIACPLAGYSYFWDCLQ